MSDEHLVAFISMGPNHPNQLGLLSKRVRDIGGNLIESIKYLLGDRACVAAYASFVPDPRSTDLERKRQLERGLEQAALLSVSLAVTEEFRSCDISVQRTNSWYEFRRDHWLTADVAIYGQANKPGELDKIVSMITEKGLVIVRHRAYEVERQPGSSMEIGPFKAQIRLIMHEHLHLNEREREKLACGDGPRYKLWEEPEVRDLVEQLNSTYKIDTDRRFGAWIVKPE